MNKCPEVMEHIKDSEPDVIFLSETWMPEERNNVTALIKSYGYKLLHNRRKNRQKLIGGGVGIMLRTPIICKHINNQQFSSFEHSVVEMKTNVRKEIIILISIYRILFIPIAKFFDEFQILLETVSADEKIFVIAGDVNIHLDNEDDIHTKRFNEILDIFNMKQHITVPTHIRGHTLDIVITHNESPTIINIHVDNVEISDHYLVKFDIMNVVPNRKEMKEIHFRNFKRIDNIKFRDDIKRCYEEIETNNFPQKIEAFHHKVRKVVDKHAPMIHRKIKVVPDSPWFDEEYRALRRLRRKAEKRYRRSKSEQHKIEFIQLRKQTTALAFTKKRKHFMTNIEKCNGNSKSLFSCLNKLIDNNQEKVLPSYESAKDLAQRFQTFFKEKIDKIRQTFKTEENIRSCHMRTNARLDDFQLTTEEEVKSIITSYGINSSPDDPIPVTMLKMNSDLLIPIWTNLVNLSLSQGSMDCLKNAVLIPLIKELEDLCNKDFLPNYRPVSNLFFIGKLIERVVARRLQEHMNQWNLNINKEYGYKTKHSPEMLLVKVVDDLLMICDKKSATLLMLLDLSAAFDTVDQKKLLEILQNEIGVNGTALLWFKSFLISRTFKVKIDSEYSRIEILLYGVPQGSVLGPILFNIYIRSFYERVESLGFEVEGFADDHQVRLPFQPIFQVKTLTHRVQKCFETIKTWMKEFFLKLNTGKTKFLLICSPSVRNEIMIKGTIVDGKCIRFVRSARNLGVIIDDELNFNEQISKVVSSCFYTIRKITRIRNFLETSHLKTLVSALILSKIDYCNALYLGLSAINLEKLQSVQNSAARLIFKGNKFDRTSISKQIQELHWLRVKDRITFKVLLTVHKSLNGIAPDDIQLKFKKLSSERVEKLVIPTSNSRYGDKSISVKAPKLWNCLPQELRSESDINQFKKKLKTFLFIDTDNLYRQAAI